MILMRVDLPAPLSPTSPVISPVGMLKGSVLQGDDRAETLADPFHAKKSVRHLCTVDHGRQALSMARSESPSRPSEPFPGKTMSPPISGRPATCESASLQSASDIGGPQSPATAGSRFEIGLHDRQRLFPGDLSTTEESADAIQVGG